VGWGRGVESRKARIVGKWLLDLRPHRTPRCQTLHYSVADGSTHQVLEDEVETLTPLASKNLRGPYRRTQQGTLDRVRRGCRGGIVGLHGATS
jgi:hypothetical protein